jgi:hypothetical protein
MMNAVRNYYTLVLLSFIFATYIGVWINGRSKRRLIDEELDVLLGEDED